MKKKIIKKLNEKVSFIRIFKNAVRVLYYFKFQLYRDFIIHKISLLLKIT